MVAKRRVVKGTHFQVQEASSNDSHAWEISRLLEGWLFGSAPNRTDSALPERRRPRMKTIKLASALAFLMALFFPGMAFAQTDPGVRSNTGVNAGQPYASVSANANDLAFYQAGFAQFTEHQTVTGDNPGLGPRFNLDSCGACHSQPAPGGTSPAAGVFPNVGPNPQSQVIAKGVVIGSTNTIPFFVQPNGPVREADSAIPTQTHPTAE